MRHHRRLRCEEESAPFRESEWTNFYAESVSGECDFEGANKLLQGVGFFEELELRLDYPVIGLCVPAN
ncbi:hypothetical protein JHK82_050625 [Glycine max]|uniref:Uncharacterized protein n=2 Tax=Glycine subgen. Soja TaxID=1462606 RepID=K7MSQ0_SOYBN|nr:hypothetical protein JHK86_050477 [Glycine max]KAG4924775.1 hypothetical protein JHK87_050315 [Glycine soja]KAG4936417.1 hypothetical protein JHK85_051336 [Glycine max]KAG5091847.1 hypothetical protein JHK82_050625 [Glycine max]KAG5094946.1 hypothetical protein JHK84_050534 [Glycine max]